jgi:hypothetical protein
MIRSNKFLIILKAFALIVIFVLSACSPEPVLRLEALDEDKTVVQGMEYLQSDLDESAAGFFDGGESSAHGGPGNTAAPVALAGKDASDPPVGRFPQLLGVGLRILDVRKLSWRSVLTPADALVSVIDENLMDSPVAHVGLFGLTIPRGGMAGADTLRVEAHAPAAAPDPVVRIHEVGEIVPGI